MLDEREPGPTEQGFDVRHRTGDQVVDGDHIVAPIEQGPAEMRPEKPGPAGDHDT